VSESDSIARPSPGGEASSASLTRQVLVLALPALGEQALNYAVGLFDTWLAGRPAIVAESAGTATSAVGLAAYVSWLASLIFALVGTGTTALISRAWGAGDTAQLNRVLNVSLAWAGILGLIVAVGQFTLAPHFADLQNMHGIGRDIGVNYLRVDAVGEFFMAFCLVGTAAFRGVGDMRTPMLVLGVVNAVNMIVSPALVYGWFGTPWGAAGIVGGTVVARVLGGLIVLGVLLRGQRDLVLRLGEWRLNTPETPRILRIGLPALVDGLLMWSGHFAFLMIVSRLAGGATPDANRAAHIIGIQVEGLTYLPASAWGYASMALIGHALGAGRPAQALAVGHTAARHGMFLALAAAIFYAAASPWIYAALTDDAAVQAVGIPAMRVLAFYQVPLSAMIIYIFSMRGAGDTRGPLVINLVGIFGVRLPLGYLFGITLDGGLIGVWSAMSIDVALRCLVAWRYFASGRPLAVHV
jgi:MATE family multidrug resistance protein